MRRVNERNAVAWIPSAKNSMKEVDWEVIQKVQEVDKRAALFFAEFCKKNNLTCYMCGGGCIGAIRHKGFIPWDDDLDFFMPRKDYEKLKQLWKDTDNYALLYPKKDYNDHNMFITLRDRRTTLIKPYQADIDTVHGIPIDIFPLDGFPDGSFKRKKQVFWALVYQLFCAQIVPENHGKLVTFAGRVILGVFRSSNLRYKIWRYAERKMSKYDIESCRSITEICAGPVYMRNKYPKELFSEAMEVEFEDVKLPIPIGYDQYLRIVFGDYMKMPPEEKRVPQHDAVFIDTDNPYTKYKGKYYCVK